jgi:hypothetical protein
MPRQKIDSRALRQLAQHVLQQTSGFERPDLVTSLVRQWITYDGKATLFVDQQQLDLPLVTTTPDKPSIRSAQVPNLSAWIRGLQEDWKIDPDELPDVFEQLNLGQSAEVVNRDGIGLRLWVNPREKSKGVEELVKRPVPPGTKRDNGKIATDIVQRELGEALPHDERELLARSLVRQWQQYQGAACLFLDREQLVCTLTELADGGCNVSVQRRSANLEPLLSSLGIAEETIPQVIARINLAQEIEFRDRKGVPSVLWHDPRTRRICTRPLPPPKSSPFFCPRCNAVLSAWRAGERQQTCVHCGQTVVRS